jgi:hypothetical protein
MGRAVRVVVLAVVVLAALPAGGWAAAAAPARGTATGVTGAVAAAALADFNGDGIDDLVVGVPGENLGATADAGVVDVLYGSESGLSDGTSQQLTQALPEAGDGFGSAVATGDFNGDIFTDLAVGVPGENLGATADAGVVEVFYGGGGGLPGVGDQLLRQGAAGMAGAAEAGDRFGAALACSTPATRPTWPSGRRARTSAPPPTPGRSPWSTAPPVGCWAAPTSRSSSPHPRPGTASGRRWRSAT